MRANGKVFRFQKKYDIYILRNKKRESTFIIIKYNLRIQSLLDKSNVE